MEDQTKNTQAGATDSERAAVDPEKTLVAPRFDAREVVTAQPVVPLAEAPPAARRRERGRQGALPLALILVSALVGGLVSVFAYRFYQQRAAQTSAQERPAVNVEAPPVAPDIDGRAAAAVTRAAAPEVVEEPGPMPEAEEVAEARAPEADEEEEVEREAEREDRAGRDLNAAGERANGAARTETRNTAAPAPARRPTARRVEEITTPTEELETRRGANREARATRRAERRAERREERRAARREGERNIDRVRAIFEGPPPQ